MLPENGLLSLIHEFCFVSYIFCIEKVSNLSDFGFDYLPTPVIYVDFGRLLPGLKES